MTNYHANCCCFFRNSGPFKNWSDYDFFKKNLDISPMFEKTPVINQDVDVGFLEEWYRCKKCQAVWRLVEPDPPFAGLWERIDFE